MRTNFSWDKKLRSGMSSKCVCSLPTDTFIYWSYYVILEHFKCAFIFWTLLRKKQAKTNKTLFIETSWTVLLKCFNHILQERLWIKDIMCCFHPQCITLTVCQSIIFTAALSILFSKIILLCTMILFLQYVDYYSYVIK